MFRRYLFELIGGMIQSILRALRRPEFFSEKSAMNLIRFGALVGALLLGLHSFFDYAMAKSDISAELKNAQALLAEGKDGQPPGYERSPE